jgi:hypothetical protein
MKAIHVRLVLAAFVVLPVFAPSQATEGQSHSRAYRVQEKQSGAAYRGPDGPAWNSNQPKSKPESSTDVMKGLCSTAPAFCPDYHGGNGA